MNSRERLLATLGHREPDRIPFDLGSTQVTGIHVVAYRRLRTCLGLPSVEPRYVIVCFPALLALGAQAWAILKPDTSVASQPSLVLTSVASRPNKGT